MRQSPDTDTRVLIATIALIVVLSWFNGCASIWEATTLAGAR